MTDRLPFSPLTHEELNRRSLAATNRAGVRAITVAEVGYLSPRNLAVFREARDEFYAYNGAALIRCAS